MAGKVPRGAQVVCELEFQPHVAGGFAGLLLQCTVANSRKYLLSVSASGTKPALEFSSYEVDFGDCFLPPTPAQPALAVSRTSTSIGASGVNTRLSTCSARSSQ